MKIIFYLIIFLLFNPALSLLAKENVQVIDTKRIININSINTIRYGIENCANWDLTKEEVELFFDQLALPIEAPPMSRIPLSCDVKGKLQLNNELWTFRINAGGYGELHNGSNSLYFTCGYFANAKPECEKFFLSIPENYEENFDDEFRVPPLFDK